MTWYLDSFHSEVCQVSTQATVIDAAIAAAGRFLHFSSLDGELFHSACKSTGRKINPAYWTEYSTRVQKVVKVEKNAASGREKTWFEYLERADRVYPRYAGENVALKIILLMNYEHSSKHNGRAS